MAIGIVRDNTVIGIEEEVTEGVAVFPQGVNSFLQTLKDGFEMSPAKELIERDVLNNSIGMITPRVGQKSVSGALPVELKAEGNEGAYPEYGSLVQSCLGSKRQILTQTTTKAGNTASQLEIEDADIGDFTVGDVVIVLEAGAHHVCAVASVAVGAGVANVGIVPAASGAFADNVVISKSATYFPASTGHPTLSLSYYWGNEIRQSATGCRVGSMSLDNFTTGQVASLGFGFEGLGFDEVDGAAPFTPDYNSALPPLILNACLFQDDAQLDINELTMSVENELGFITSTCSADGRISSRVTSRAISGSFNPYKDDTSVDQFTKFNNNTEYSLFVSAYNPSAVAGEIELGSAMGLYLPNCITIEKPVGEQEGILVENISFRATRGSDGTSDEIFLGFI